MAAAHATSSSPSTPAPTQTNPSKSNSSESNDTKEQTYTSSPASNKENEKDELKKKPKIDQVCALQDTIDSFSLSLFEALRGLRDAVAPTSLNNLNPNDPNNPNAAAANDPNNNPNNPNDGTNPANGNNTNDDDDDAEIDFDQDYEDFLTSYHNSETRALKLVATYGIPRNRDDYSRILARAEKEKDGALVSRLAGQVLNKSEAVNELAASLPGMERTKDMQMERIEELLRLNWEAEGELERVYGLAEERREEVRVVLRRVTIDALGIEEEE
mmetsp:Transcript_33519/g.41059  ORF Transcript_33519/g.41059 Transcript_33519/m.41059 type:complete len:272 (+) Transcript_33519:74-889(+)|eukprot:CAMPEP_0172511126 /NCGR_PEP_ID=MMETSP1066-20121228/234006_1 /TAXON_ID=671091 /ORGANISM="Coscinodiscus wailesii, Strain CCMP2513" /LENGTH=271 /DNA_ID=CAMNT_0013290383 /DNA_START=55 /DNA_END=870 /DNA_ORIENTATION=+